ncbi:hypothetical protein IEO21_07369 [Rhodonia placenta]|uniref:Heme haloperoxidase family profile domain-containing protein n=1 Tax=Rhodonia placenta TaxID=104341 RepID=A0A8H7TZR0_9APHY|nr:hypothetical protein IEO21_07369 [Postia placenta]
MSPSQEHTHRHGECPVTGKTNDFCPAQKGDSRSPCPALNTLANHGYIPRDGKCITPHVLMHGLRKGYRLSAPLAWVLVHGGFYLLGQRRQRICLHDLSRHMCIEHDASLVHPDVEHRDEYAPIHVHQNMLEALMSFSSDGHLMTPDDIARARVLREAEYLKPMDRLHAEIARGEMAIVMHLFNNPAPDPSLPAHPPSFFGKLKRFFKGKCSASGQHHAQPLPGVPLDLLRVWLHEERLPDGWEPYHHTGLVHTFEMSTRIRTEMNKLAKEVAKEKALLRSSTEAEQEVIAAAVTAAPDEPPFGIVLEQGEIGDEPLSDPPRHHHHHHHHQPSPSGTLRSTASTSSSASASLQVETPITPDAAVPQTILELPVLTDSPPDSPQVEEKITMITELRPVRDISYSAGSEGELEGVAALPRVAVAAC